MEKQRKRFFVVLTVWLGVWVMVSCSRPGPAFRRADINELQIRVLLSRSTPVTFGVSGGFDVRGTDARLITNRSSGVRNARITRKPDGHWDILGLHPTDPRIEIVPVPGENILWEGRPLRGRLRCLARPKGVLTINELHVDDYLMGVLNNELYSSWCPATFRALAIAARTYALYEKARRGKNADFDVFAGQGSQVYRGMLSESAKARRAVADTAGIVLTVKYGGRDKIFPTYYSSCCGGHSRPPAEAFGRGKDLPPLAGVEDPWCRQMPKKYHWGEVRFGLKKLDKKLRDAKLLTGPNRIRRIESVKDQSKRRIKTIILIDEKGKKRSIPADVFRLAVGSGRMRSTWCDVSFEKNELVLRNGRGFGHGVGLCQCGAEIQARRGATALQLLQFYYPGATPVRAY